MCPEQQCAGGELLQPELLFLHHAGHGQPVGLVMRLGVFAGLEQRADRFLYLFGRLPPLHLHGGSDRSFQGDERLQDDHDGDSVRVLSVHHGNRAAGELGQTVHVMRRVDEVHRRACLAELFLAMVVERVEQRDVLRQIGEVALPE